MLDDIDPALPEQILAGAGLAFERYEHEPTPTVADIRATTDFAVAKAVKTLAFVHGEDAAVLVAIPGEAQVDYGAVARLLGVSRSRLRRAEPEILERLGLAAGGISPIPTVRPPGATMIFDERIVGMGRVYCGGGRPELTLAVDADELIALWPEPIVAAVARTR